MQAPDTHSAHPSAPPVCVEQAAAADASNEAADAAAALFPSWVATTSLNGSKAEGKTDWAPLTGRRVIFWRDYDEVGATYMHNVLEAKVLCAGGMALSLLSEPVENKSDGTYAKLLVRLAKVDVLILDDWGLSRLIAEQRRDLLEIMEDRHNNRSTIVTSQLPLEKWHNSIGDPTLADAILDRLVHNAYKINLKGESMRKRKSELTAPMGDE